MFVLESCREWQKLNIQDNDIKSEINYLKYLEDTEKKIGKPYPSFILPEYEEAVRQRYHIFEDSNKSVRVMENPNRQREKASALSQSEIQERVRNLYNDIKSQISDADIKVLWQVYCISYFLRNNKEQCSGITSENQFCIYKTIKNYTIIYINTIPEIHKYFDSEYLILGLDYNDLFMFDLIKIPDEIPYYEKPLAVLLPKSKGLLGKQREKLIKKLKPLHEHLYKELVSKPYERVVYDLSVENEGHSDLIRMQMEYPHLIVTYQDQNNIILYDIPQNKITQGWTLDNSPENIEYFKNICRILTGKDVKIRKLVDSDTVKKAGNLVWFENDKSSLNISGKKYLSLRNQLNKIDKMIKSGELVIKEYENEIDKKGIIDCYNLIKGWSREWRSRHRGDQGEIDKIKLTDIIGSSMWHNISVFYKKQDLNTYTIIAYHNDKPIGYLSDVQSTGIYVYNADAITLNKNTIRGLRQYFNIKSIEYWTKKLGNDVRINTGYTDLNGLKELKYQLRPVRMYM